MKINKALLFIIGTVTTLALIGSGWIYHALSSDDKSAITQTELTNLQISFMKQYGVDATISEIIEPKIYEVAWAGSNGSQNISMNVGGVWVLIASIPAPATPAP